MRTPSPAGPGRAVSSGRPRHRAAALVSVIALGSAAVLTSCAEYGERAVTRELPGAPEIAERAATAPILGASVAVDGLTLELYAVPGGRRGDGSAGGLAAGDLVASSSPTERGVEVLLRRPGVSAAAAAGSGGAGPSAAVCRIAHDLHVVRLGLSEPLGDGVVVDGATEVAIEPMPQGQILRPSPLPAGWVLLDEHPLREGDRQTGWAQRYGPSDSVATLSIVQRLAELGPTQRLQVGRDEMAVLALRGTEATWSRQANFSAASLVWVEGGYEVALSSSSPDGTEPPLSRQAMLDAAASLAAGT